MTSRRRAAAAGAAEAPAAASRASGAPAAPPDSVRPSAALTWGLRLLGLGVVAAGFVGGPWLWGVNHLAFLPRLALAALAVPLLLLFWPPVDAARATARWERAHRRLLTGRAAPLAAGAALLALLLALRTRAHLLGDGYLLLDVLDQGRGARPFDSFGFVLVRQLRAALAGLPAPSLTTYRVVALAAAALALLAIRRLAPRTGWDPARQLLFAGLHLAGGATLLFCGYVENYALACAALTAFTLAGVAAANGRAPLWWPAALLAAATAAHLIALLALPALVVLAWGAARPAARWRRLLLALAPTAAVGLLLVAVLATGRGGSAAATVAGALRVDSNLAQPLRPLTGAGGLLSPRVPVDVLNLLLLLVPVPLLVLATAGRDAGRRALAGAEGRFLAAHALAALAAAVLLEPKLGAARDWDLLAPHAGAAVALAVAVLPAGAGASRRLLAAALVCAVPWLWLGTDAGGSARRLAAVAPAFAPYPRGYAFEGLAQQARQRGDTAQAAAMYREACAAQPGNARFHALLGAACVTLYNESDAAGAPQERFMTEAEAAYREAYRLNPTYPAVLDNLARLCVRHEGWAECERLLGELAGRQALTASQLKLRFYCQVRLEQPGPARDTLRRWRLVEPGADIPAGWLQRLAALDGLPAE